MMRGCCFLPPHTISPQSTSGVKSAGKIVRTHTHTNKTDSPFEFIALRSFSMNCFFHERRTHKS